MSFATSINNRANATGCLAVAFALLCACAHVASGDSQTRTNSPEPVVAGATTAGAPTLGPGFVVWESNRTGDWRLFLRDLDSGPPRQLTLDEPGRHHCCPHISPDGRWVAYLSTTSGATEYPDEPAIGELRLVAAHSAVPNRGRLLVPAARTYAENRAAVWRDSQRLIYVAADATTVELDIASGSARTLIPLSDGEIGFLVNAPLTFASTGYPTFSPFDQRTGAVATRSPLAGCQPYFSHDGRFGVWTNGAGGPLAAIDLATRKKSTILRKNDPRMPEGFGYAYFPMLSRDGTLFAYAASQGGHDHFTVDYEVFVAEVDPGTLELLDVPVRITRDRATDRYPDVFRAALELGRLSGEAPLRVRLEPPQPGNWAWDFGDGGHAQAAGGEHLYERPGRYRVTATRVGSVASGHVASGQVTVATAAPPRAVSVALQQAGRVLRIGFDEPVAEGGIAVAFVSGRAATTWRLEADGRVLVVELAEAIDRPDSVRLSGIRDRAGRPNAAPALDLAVEPPGWPSRSEGAIFLWDQGDAANLVLDPATGVESATALEPAGRVWLDHDQRMVLGGDNFGGSFGASAEVARRVAEQLRSTNEMSLELTLDPAMSERPNPSNTGDTAILVFGSTARDQNFRLFERAGQVWISMRVGPRGPAGNPELALAEISPNSPTHFALTYSPGQLVAYRDGERVLESTAIVGDFFHFRPHRLAFGAQSGIDGWRGAIEGVAIWNRVLDDGEVRENALRRQRIADQRPPVPVIVVEATLVAKSKLPTLREISPYRDALAIFDYRVERTISGKDPGPRLRVAHRAILNGETLALDRLVTGQPLRLVLEPLGDNPQVTGMYTADTLEPQAGAPLFLALDPGP